MPPTRPDPDALLRRVAHEERKQSRGKLTIYFGAAPGVGKTFAMLEEASYKRDVDAADVVVGVVETHGRFDTATLLAGFERLPKREIEYRGRLLEEFDLDAALARRPGVLLVDELAHTNVEGSRHPKRWQDVEELLDAGIDVCTTLNVQHVESLNDVVAQITGVRVRETVPDSMLDEADEIKLIDLPPEKLLERLREGKVYIPEQAQRALDSFFRKGNLIALRELALRRTAERVDAEMDEYRRAHGIEQSWGASDRLLVCIGPSPYSADLLRSGRRMAAGLRARWFAVMVETPATLRLSAADRARISATLRLAEQLGAETVTLTGEHAASEILAFAREHDVTKIVVGKPRSRGWRERLTTPFVDELVLKSGTDIDVYVTAGVADARPSSAALPYRVPQRAAAGYLVALGAIVVATAIGALLFGRSDLADVVMIYLLGVVVVSMRSGFRAAVFAAAAGVLAFDFFFTPPYFTFTVADLRYLVTFGVMLVVALVITGLTQRVRDQALISHHNERRTAMLYAMSRELSRTQDRSALVQAAARHIESALECKLRLYQRDADGALVTSYTTPGLGGCGRARARSGGVGLVESARGRARNDHRPSWRRLFPPAAGFRRRGRADRRAGPGRRRSGALRRRRAATSGRCVRGPAGDGPGASDARHRDRARAGHDRDRAATEHAAELRVARPAHAAGRHEGRGDRSRRRRGRAGCEHASRARRLDRRGDGPVGAAGVERVGHDSSRVG